MKPIKSSKRETIDFDDMEIVKSCLNQFKK